VPAAAVGRPHSWPPCTLGSGWLADVVSEAAGLDGHTPPTYRPVQWAAYSLLAGRLPGHMAPVAGDA